MKLFEDIKALLFGSQASEEYNLRFTKMLDTIEAQKRQIAQLNQQISEANEEYNRLSASLTDVANEKNHFYQQNVQLKALVEDMSGYKASFEAIREENDKLKEEIHELNQEVNTLAKQRQECRKTLLEIQKALEMY